MCKGESNRIEYIGENIIRIKLNIQDLASIGFFKENCSWITRPELTSTFKWKKTTRIHEFRSLVK